MEPRQVGPRVAQCAGVRVRGRCGAVRAQMPRRLLGDGV